MIETPILELKGISKTFPGVKALDDVSLSIKRGSVHALVGENGAGKSTLIKILTGIYVKYEGTVLLEGEEIRFSHPSEAKAKGISVVHQELKLAEPLNVVENIYMGNLKRTKNGLVDWKRMEVEAQELINSLGVEINIKETVSNLTIAKKQIVEICKSIMHNCKILIMDEPSATLTHRELDVLFGIIEKLNSQGTTILFISHRLDEVFRLADRVSVLRDGVHVATENTSDINKSELVRLMVGRNVSEDYPRTGIMPGKVIFEAKNITRGRILKDISFQLREGEILGIAGLVGSGRTELIRAILGIDKMDHGELILNGETIQHQNFCSAIENGFGLVPEDRKQQGITADFSIKANICMTDLQKIAKNGVINNLEEESYAVDLAKKLRVSTSNVETLVGNLSGGNQQKIVIAKWLFRNCSILVMDEPTRGIDVA
ncbi:MAG: sugar ABC transporter ATP-binding protein, partial [Leptolinea sp.]|nr:sugar ABC transporter ATP-binding protein [Leptolinea sp.]